MISFPFDSKITGYQADGTPVYDRAADSSVLRAWMRHYFCDGVFSKNGSLGLPVTQNNEMSVSVGVGSVMIQGAIGILEEAAIVSVPAADGVYDRIDTIVARLDLDTNVRGIEIKCLNGTPGEEPIAPALTRNLTMYELALADIFIPANSTQVLQSNITDTRLDTERCGVCAVPMQVFDTTDLYRQIQSDIEDSKDATLQYVNSWMQLVQDTLDQGTEGVLLNEIKTCGYQTYLHAKSGTVHELTLLGGGNNIRFVATSGYEHGNTFAINGVAVEARQVNGCYLPSGYFSAGSVVTAHVESGTIYFSSASQVGLWSLVFTADGWSADVPYTQTVQAEGMLESDAPDADVDMSGATTDTAADIAAAWSLIGRIDVSDGAVTAVCFEDKPEIDMTIRLKAVR